MGNTLKWTRGVGRAEYWYSGASYDIEACPKGYAAIAASTRKLIGTVATLDEAKALCEQHRAEQERMKAMRQQIKKQRATA